MMKCVWFRLARPEPRRWKSQGWRRRAQVTRLRSSTSLWRRSLSASAACCSNDRATEAAGTRTRDGPSSIIRSVTSASCYWRSHGLKHRGRIEDASMKKRLEKNAGIPRETYRHSKHVWDLKNRSRRWLLGEKKESFIFEEMWSEIFEMKEMWLRI